MSTGIVSLLCTPAHARPHSQRRGEVTQLCRRAVLEPDGMALNLDPVTLRLLDVKAEIIPVGKALSQLRCWPPARELGTVIIHISCGCSSSRKEGDCPSTRTMGTFHPGARTKRTIALRCPFHQLDVPLGWEEGRSRASVTSPSPANLTQTGQTCSLGSWNFEQGCLEMGSRLHPTRTVMDPYS
ncbi:hypothetical protein Cadr_000010729 [Camelus dromedarius]|uniref:Uncharacterized protein n=1 Tax=Camelus dromedarius TaxID=9838 RepID=A0A5N4DUK1_CAMDR|nr:hypothetical protein Cadr_000010729 [Camelus dromedarius]